MGNIIENKEDNYNWENESVYLIEEDDYVNGGEDGVSNRQAKQLTRRTRDLFNRIADLLKRVISGDHDTLSSAKNYTDISTSNTATTTLKSAKDYTDISSSNTATTTLKSAKDYTDISSSNTATTTLKSAKDYTDIKVSSLVDSSPETLNTLNELASALGDDPNFATTVATQLGNKVDKTDPRLTDNRPADGGTSNYAKRLMTDLDVTIGATFDGTSKWKLDANHSLYKGVSVSHADSSSNTDKVGGYSANDLFINKGADHSDIDNLPASGMWGVNGDYGGSNLPFSYGAVVQFAGANGNGGAPIFQMASRFNGNHFYVRSKWHTETLASNGWRELYHSGNFNPNASEKLFLVDSTSGYGYIRSVEKSFNTSALLFGANYGHNTKKDCFYIYDGNVHCINNLYVQDQTVFHSGNFNPATKANTADSMKVLCAGVVGMNGKPTKWAHKSFNSDKIETGYYYIDHDIRHTNYEVQLTAISKEAGPMYASVYSKEDNRVYIYTANDTELDDSSFFFQIFEFWPS